MKPREGLTPDLARATPPARRVGRPRTEELDPGALPGQAEDVSLEGLDAGDTGGRPEAIGLPLDTAQVDIARDRRVTLTSPIPAQLAEDMLFGQDEDRPTLPGTVSMAIRAARDPAAPAQDARPLADEEDDDHTRRVGDSDRQRLAPGSGRLPSAELEIAPWRQRAAALIDEARAALDEGDLTAAVTAAERALREADEAPPPGIVEVIEPARPLLARVFGAYVGPLGGVPVLAPRAVEIARARLGESEQALIARIDGTRTLEELFDGSGLGSTDALRLAARLLRAGAVRII
ncbi:MAG TPA: hypothetical protein VHO06_11665 [Polyangia bacterium]|nr:hypothetical protein [Polyangia bacterium]